MVGAIFLSLRRFGLSSYLLLRRLVRTVRYFSELLQGDVSGLPKAPVAAKRALRMRQKSDTAQISTSRLPTAEEVWDACVQSHEATGVWPISFSYPKPPRPPISEQSATLCPVFPGHRYSFDDESQYLEVYGRHLFSLTHKKAGWDCFRHVEIFASGSIPYMPDASLIPAHTMVHYPKQFLSEVASHLMRRGGTVSFGTQQKVMDYFAQHLTSRAMAEYILRVVPAGASGKILFVDEAAGQAPDYQSVLTLIGLKQIFGGRVSLGSPIPYIYDDWPGDARELYGRGFGYTRVLSPEQKSFAEASNEFDDLGSGFPANVDLLIVGSITRNYERALDLLGRFSPSQTVWIHGEDEGPTSSDISRYRDCGVTIFTRELCVG